MSREHSNQLKLVAFISVLLGAALACGSLTKLVTLTLHAEQVDSIVRRAASHIPTDKGSFNLRDVELKEGFIRLHGDFQPEHGDKVPGSVDLVLEAQDGELIAKVIEIEFEGVSFSDAQIRLFNDQLEEYFSEAASGDRDRVDFVEVKITPQAIQIQIRFLP